MSLIALLIFSCTYTTSSQISDPQVIFYNLLSFTYLVSYSLPSSSMWTVAISVSGLLCLLVIATLNDWYGGSMVQEKCHSRLQQPQKCLGVNGVLGEEMVPYYSLNMD
ncbi:hypothetical protein BDW60DRAFT_199710 [Aspergillus nidulans var. acristatus]